MNIDNDENYQHYKQKEVSEYRNDF